MNIPLHIAIIMDGNGRWARRKGLPRIAGHRRGVESVKETIKACLKFGVRYLTLYAFSTENWRRPQEEIKGLFVLLENFLDREAGLLHANGIRLRIIGERDRIYKRIIKKIEQFERETSAYDTLNLTIALSYGARQEIIQAVRSIASDITSGRLAIENIDEVVFSGYLYTHDLPDPDLLIRTSGEMRISNFLLWQASYAEFYVTPELWPDFREADLKKAIEEYSRRERRFGRSG